MREEESGERRAMESLILGDEREDGSKMMRGRGRGLGRRERRGKVDEVGH